MKSFRRQAPTWILAVLMLAACTGPTASSTSPAATLPAAPTSSAAQVSSAAAATTATSAASAPAVRDTLPPNVRPGIEIPPGQVEAAVAKLDGLAAAMMAKSGVPGMAVAVVYRGKVLYAKGFGVRKVGEPAKVDANTVFQLASVSKSVGATVVAHEVTAGKVSWNTPVQAHLPSFELSDRYVSARATISDLYAHRSGLPDHAGDLLEDLGYTGSQIIDRLRVLPLDVFRTSYHYTNFGLTAAAESVAAAAGTDWATLSADSVYRPLGMTSTSSRFADFAAAKDRAYTHVKVNGQWVAKYVRDPDQQSPAGGVSSSVSDLAKWMIMVLNDGTGANGAKISSPEALTPAVTPEIVSSPAQTAATRPGFYGYGFDVTAQSSGRTQVSHSGAFSAGAGTNFVLMPLAGVGIVTLTNGMPVGAAETLNQEFGDLVSYGHPEFDWWDLYSAAFKNLSEPFGKYAGKTPPSKPRPAGPVADYVGVYANEFVGEAKISARGKTLTLTLGPRNMTFPMSHWDGDTFTYAPVGESANPGSVSAVTFTRSPGGRASKVVIEYYQQAGQGTFTR